MADIISRAQWGAAPERSRPRMRLPATECWFHHTVTQTTSNPHADMRVVQRVGLQRFGYFSYSWCVHTSGAILEGQGFNVGAHTAGRNSTSFGIALIGNYDERVMVDDQLDAVRWLIGHLIEIGALRRGVYPTGGHRDAPNPKTGKPTATACPGRYAYRRLGELRAPWEPKQQPWPEGVPVSNASFAAILVHPNGGYLQVAADGGVFAWGDAPFFGSLGGMALNEPITGAAWAPDFEGYYLQARDGGVFAFGSAVHVGNALWTGDG